MLVLAVDTATPAVTAAVLEGTRVLAARRTVDPRAHAELLTPHILECLAESGYDATDLDVVVCGTGPGPYTGLRVGLVTAVSFGDALGIPVRGVCSLDAIAGACVHRGPLLVVTDARRREVYWARYQGGRRIAGPGVAAPAALERGRATAVAGSPVLAASFGVPVLAPEFPDPAALVGAATPGPTDSGTGDRGAAGPVRPLYLRRPDAVAPPAPSPAGGA